MRQLTKEQADFVAYLNSPLAQAEALRLQKLENERQAAAQAQWEAERAEREARERATEEAMKPLFAALRAAGIKLSLSSYEGLWGSYQLGSGTVVEFDVDDFDTEEDD